MEQFIIDSNINNLISDLIKTELPKWISSLPGAAKTLKKSLLIRTGKCFDHYYSIQLKKQSQIKTILNDIEPVSLFKVYVPQDISMGEHHKMEVNYIDLCNVGNRILLTGTAGTGKSIAFRYLFLQSFQSKATLPCFLYLRSANDNDSSILQLLLDSINQGAPEVLDDGDFRHFLHSGRISLFLDGLDEVIDSRRERIISEIHEIADSFPATTIFLSSRPTHFQSWEMFNCFSILPLTTAKARSIIEKTTFSNDLKLTFSGLIEHTLQKTHATFISVPLLLTLMLLMYSRNADIPRQWHLFYEQAYEMLFHRHDASKPGGYKRLYRSKLDIYQFCRVFSALSYICLQSGIRSMTKDYLVDKINDAAGLVGTSVDPEDYLDDLEKRVCLVLQDGLEFNYTHKTFVEFFAGKFVASQSDSDIVEEIMRSLPERNLESFLEAFYHTAPNMFISAYVLPLFEEFKDLLLVKRNYRTMASYRYYLRRIEVTYFNFKNERGLYYNSDGQYSEVLTRLFVALSVMSECTYSRDELAFADFAKSLSKSQDLQEESKVLELTMRNITNASGSQFKIIENVPIFGRKWLMSLEGIESELKTRLTSQRDVITKLLNSYR